jgi:hypothetical protein
MEMEVSLGEKPDKMKLILVKINLMGEIKFNLNLLVNQQILRQQID